MADTLRLKTDQTPTIFNKDMAVGALLGNILGRALCMTLGGGPASIAFSGLVSAVSSAYFSGQAGKRQMELDNEFGKAIHKPKFWNKDALLGGLIGSVVAGFGLRAMLLLGTSTIVPGMAVAAITLTFASIIGGVIVGGNAGKRHMEQELMQAMQQDHGKSHSMSPSRAMEPELSAEQSRASSYTAQLDAARERAALQEKQI